MIKLGDYFNFKRGNATEISTKINSNSIDSVRLISATGYNNGGEISVIPGKKETIYENKITVGNNGSIGLGKAFFHPYKFIATSDVTVIFPIDGHNINLYEGLYLKTAMEKQKDQFAYGFKLSNERLKNLEVHLPVKTNNVIDWDKMNHTIRKLSDKVQHFGETNNSLDKSLDLSSRNWKSFSISNIFGKPISGNDYPQYLRIGGSTPFIGSSSKNNGITDYIGKTKYSNKKISKNVISVNRNGSVGYSFYHPYEAYFSGDTRYLKLDNINKYIALFMTTVIMQQKDKFNYGFKLGSERLSSLKINLPVNMNGNPDWIFMEKYIKSLPNADFI